MQKFEDHKTGILIRHEDTWLGNVDISFADEHAPGGRRQVSVEAKSLLAGQPIFVGGSLPTVYPGDVMLRVTAICVERFMRTNMIRVAEHVGCTS